MRRWMAIATFLSLSPLLSACGSGAADADAVTAAAEMNGRALTIDAYDLALSRLNLAYVDVTGSYIDNAEYARRLAETGARRAAYFRLLDPDYEPITLVQFEMDDAEAIALYIAAQHKRLGIAVDAGSADGTSASRDTEPEGQQFVSTGDAEDTAVDKPQWAIERRRNLIIIGDPNCPAWDKAREILQGL